VPAPCPAAPPPPQAAVEHGEHGTATADPAALRHGHGTARELRRSARHSTARPRNRHGSGIPRRHDPELHGTTPHNPHRTTPHNPHHTGPRTDPHDARTRTPTGRHPESAPEESP